MSSSRHISKKAAMAVGIVVVAAALLVIVRLTSSSGPAPTRASQPTQTAPSGTTKPSVTPPEKSPSLTSSMASKTAALCSVQPRQVRALVRSTSSAQVSFEAMRDAIGQLDDQIVSLSVVLPASRAATQFTADLAAVEQAWRDALTAYDKKQTAKARARTNVADRSIAALAGDLTALNTICPN